MADGIERLHETMQRIERLLTRFELDKATGLHAIDYGPAIAALCDQFEAQMHALTRGAAPGAPSRVHGSSMSVGFSISHTRSGERS
jgi:hypothetical protein